MAITAADYLGDEYVDAYLLRLIDEWAESQPPPKPIEPLPPTSKQKEETAEQRQARRYGMCVEAGLTLPTNDYARLPDGIRKLAEEEGITRQSFAEDVKAHIRRSSSR